MMKSDAAPASEDPEKGISQEGVSENEVPEKARKPSPSSDEERAKKRRRERRLAANRLSALKSRYRKSVMLEELQKTKNSSSQKNEALRKENEFIRSQVNAIQCVAASQGSGVSDTVRKLFSLNLPSIYCCLLY